MINQHEDDIAVYGRKADHFEFRKRKKIDPGHWANIGPRQQNILNIMKKKVTTGILSNRHSTSRTTKAAAIDDRNIVTSMRKSVKTTVNDITSNHLCATLKVSQLTVRGQKYRDHTTGCKLSISSKNRETILEFEGTKYIFQ